MFQYIKDEVKGTFRTLVEMDYRQMISQVVNLGALRLFCDKKVEGSS